MNTKGIVFATNGSSSTSALFLDGKFLHACHGVSFKADANDGLTPMFNIKLYSLRQCPVVDDEVDCELDGLVDKYKFVFCGYDNTVYVNNEMAGRIMALEVDTSNEAVKVNIVTNSDLTSPPGCDWLTVSH